MPVVAITSIRSGDFPRSMPKIYRGEQYDDNDPRVVARPDLFEPVEQAVARRRRPTSTLELPRHRKKAETTRKAPGEQRDIEYPCVDCDYEATSEHGLKVHRAKAHK